MTAFKVAPFINASATRILSPLRGSFRPPLAPLPVRERLLVDN
jgi:hypothetical protein